MHKFYDNPAERTAAAEARVPARLEIGGIAIAPASVLAPMAGVTDTVFRRFIREMGGCGLIMTEFTSADGILRGKDRKAKRYLHFYADEHPISAQLFGSKPESLAEAARMIEGFGFDLVDLNLGCPAKKVVKCNGGSGLLRDLPLIERIFRSIRAAVKIPFTVKFRAGWNEQELVYPQLARLAEECGLNAIAMHARTREQGYGGQAQWRWITELKQLVGIPVIGNGDIRSPEDAAAMVAETGCDAVMIGRSAASNPWIFRQIAEYTERGSYETATEADRFHMIHRYFEMLIEEEYRDTPGKMKQFASWFTHGVRNGAQLRKAIYHAQDERQILGEVERFFEQRRALPAFDNLRVFSGVPGSPTRTVVVRGGVDAGVSDARRGCAWRGGNRSIEVFSRRLPECDTPGPHWVRAAPRGCRSQAPSQTEVQIKTGMR
jgi:nifR3 family TIM-barrel protein